MRKLRTSIFFLAVFTFLPSCYAHHLAVVVAKDNKADDIPSASLAKIFKGETRNWSDGKKVVVVLHKDSTSEIQTLERLNKMTERQLRGVIVTHKDSIRLVDKDIDVLNFVQTVPGAIGLVDVHSINDKVKVVKVDGKLPLEDGYLPH
jgi:ABC-type phosphate transport system substrate-binding protein